MNELREAGEYGNLKNKDRAVSKKKKNKKK